MCCWFFLLSCMNCSLSNNKHCHHIYKQEKLRLRRNEECLFAVSLILDSPSASSLAAIDVSRIWETRSNVQTFSSAPSEIDSNSALSDPIRSERTDICLEQWLGNFSGFYYIRHWNYFVNFKNVMNECVAFKLLLLFLTCTWYKSRLWKAFEIKFVCEVQINVTFGGHFQVEASCHLHWTHFI